MALEKGRGPLAGRIVCDTALWPAYLRKKSGRRSTRIQSESESYLIGLDIHVDDSLIELLLAGGLLRLTVLLGVLVNLLESKLAILEVLTEASVE